MELHILEHSLKVASIEKEGIQICTHGLIKLAFLASKTRCVITFTTSNVHQCSFIFCLCCSMLSVLILFLTLNQTGAAGTDGTRPVHSKCTCVHLGSGYFLQLH